ncbi:hypothetical protein N0V95_002758 [Ascochyta clinopodiicola]|nr:hypothetical protein N0V95_002758 [Ascochyta clinopodiicola]
MDVANRLALLERIIDYVFNRKILGVEAMNSGGQPVHFTGQWHQLQRNDRLAVLGDKAIDMVLCPLWFDARDAQGRPLTVGQWSSLQQDLVTDDHLAERAFSLGLDAVVIVNPGHFGRISNRVMAKALEAIIGAVYKDSGYNLEAVNAKALEVQQLTDYTFTNELLAAEAVQMAAPQIAVVYGSFRGLPNNKRLSVLGNAVLTKVLCGLWFNARDSSGNELTPTDWTILRNDILSNESLGQRGYTLKIDTLVCCNPGTLVSAKMVAATLEALIGAVHQDGGDDAALRVIKHLGFTEHRLLMVTLHNSHIPT